jgi:hypothetical protein
VKDNNNDPLGTIKTRITSCKKNNRSHCQYAGSIIIKTNKRKKLRNESWESFTSQKKVLNDVTYLDDSANLDSFEN